MADIYGTDMASQSGDWQANAQADVATISGPQNLQKSIERRVGTRIGALFYTPSYGNPIFDMISQTITNDWISRATVAGRTCVMADPRIADAQVTVTPNPPKRTVVIQYEWTDVEGNTGQFAQEVNVPV